MTPTPANHNGSMPFRSPTEEQNPRTADIDLLSPVDMVTRIVDEDARVIDAVRGASGAIGHLVEVAVAGIRAGGRVRYIGAGTSGRLGVLDAVELLPTYGVGSEWVAATLAGGEGAMFRSAEEAEDDPDRGTADVDDLGKNDVLVALAASGRTPYVRGALDVARTRGAATALITANPSAELLSLVDVPIVLDTGAEVVTGSTRMKAATAQKIALNAFSTATMIALGKTYSNFMVDVSPSNAKLRTRLVRLLTQATDVDLATAERALDAADGEVKTALVVLLSPGAVDAAAARASLDAHGGSVRAAVREHGVA